MFLHMPELPHISGDEAIKVFKRLAIGTLRSAIRQAGITVEDFAGAYQNK
jgi:hypothetical protein